MLQQQSPDPDVTVVAVVTPVLVQPSPLPSPNAVHPTTTCYHVHHPGHLTLGPVPPIIPQSFVTNGDITMTSVAPVPHVMWCGCLKWTAAVQNGFKRERMETCLPCQLCTCRILPANDVQSMTSFPRPKHFLDFVTEWPTTMTLQLVPKLLIRQIDRRCFEGVRAVRITFSQNDARPVYSLIQLMTGERGSAGCVHFGSPGESSSRKGFLMLYSKVLASFIGFIPREPSDFIDELILLAKNVRQTSQI